MRELSKKTIFAVEKYYKDKRRSGRRFGNNAEDILEATRVANLFVRGEAFPQHLGAQLHSLLDPFEIELGGLLGFNIGQALQIYNGLAKLVHDRTWTFIATRMKEPIVDFQGMREKWNSERKLSDEFISRVCKELRPVAHRIYEVTGEETALATGIDSIVVRNFLDFFTSEFGQGDLGSGWPSVYESFDRAPFLRLSNDLWLVHLGANSIFRFGAAIEEAIKRDQGLWSRYEKHRSAYLERHAVNMIKSTSPHANGWVRLVYAFDDGDGTKDFDLDGLVLVDQTAFLIEAKAGSMTPAARRGSRSAIDQIKRLVADAHQQTERAARYIRSSNEVYFSSSKGSIHIRNRDLSRIYLISVTLDSLNAFTANESWLSRSGIVKRGELVWSVCDLDLKVVTELVTGAGEFVSFLDFRLTVHEVERVIVVDELDWFGLFLIGGGRPVRELGPRDWGGVLFADFTVEIEDYYYSKLGLRTPSPKPRQRIPSTIAVLIEILERNGPHGFIDAVVILLRMTSRERKSIAKSIEQLWRLKEKKNLAFRVKLGSGSVLCYSRSRNLFRGYAKAAKYSLQADWVVCILQTTRRGALVHSERYPWKETASLETFSHDLLMQLKSRYELFQI